MAGIEDLELEVDKPSRMTVLDPATNMPMKDKSDPPKTAYVDVYSSDSSISRKFKQEIKTSRLRTRNPNSLTGAKLEDEDVQLIAALTAGWFLVTRDGEPIDLDCTRENALKVYANHKMAWLFDQVDAHAGARGNFSKVSSPNSSKPQSTSGNSTASSATAQANETI